MNIYDIGDNITCSNGTFLNGTAPFDPTTVVAGYRNPEGTRSEGTYNVAGTPTISKSATGVYSFALPIPLSRQSAGLWDYWWQGLDAGGTVQAAFEGQFRVKRSARYTP